MTEASAPHQYDFSNMPLTNEQLILASLLRIEVLLAPKPVALGSQGVSQKTETPDEHAAKIKALEARIPSGRRK